MRNYTITSVWDIPIRINVSLIVFLPVLAWLIGSGTQIEVYAGFIDGLTGVTLDLEALRRGNTPWLIGIVAAVGLFVSVTLHELGHSWVALRYGIEIESITLWILGGLAALKSIPREWNREFWIAIAGPAVSLALGVGCWVGLLALPEGVPVLRFVVGWLAITNVTLAAFNLLPAFPMDGGRILRALLARNRPYGSATRIAARIGVIFAILFAVVGVFGRSFILVLLALFVYGAATTESRVVLLDELLEGLSVGDIYDADQRPVEADRSVADLVDRMIRDKRSVYAVRDGDAFVGAVSLSDLKGVPAAERGSTTVGSVATDVPTVDSGADAFETLAGLQGGGEGITMVAFDGIARGVLTREDFASAMAMQREFRSSFAG